MDTEEYKRKMKPTTLDGKYILVIFLHSTTLPPFSTLIMEKNTFHSSYRPSRLCRLNQIEYFHKNSSKFSKYFSNFLLEKLSQD